MPVVSNTSPLLNLAIINQLSRIQQQFGEIIIPHFVNFVCPQISSNNWDGVNTVNPYIKIHPLLSSVAIIKRVTTPKIQV